MLISECAAKLNERRKSAHVNPVLREVHHLPHLHHVNLFQVISSGNQNKYGASYLKRQHVL